MRKIMFIIPGTPKGKGRPKFARRGNFVTAYTPKETASYENLVKLIFLEAAAKYGWKKPERDVPLCLTVITYSAIPASWSKKKQMSALHDVRKPDADNVGKVIQDALNSIAFEDDCSIADLHVMKRFVNVLHSDPCAVCELAMMDAGGMPAVDVER